MAVMERLDVKFKSGETECAGWLYRPTQTTTERAPVVVLAHGLGCLKEMRLDAYCERFAQAGFAALAFDYRYFGDSGGEPRQLLDVERQLEDWAAALAYVRGLPDVDSDRVAIWGTSLAGGHVIEVAARDGRVAAVVSQCPFADGAASVLAMDPRSSAQVTLLAMRDQVSRLRRKPPVMVKLIGPPGSAALMTAPDAEPGIRAIAPSKYVNAVAARVGLQIPLYRPGRAASRVNAPHLYCICDHDSVAPAKSAHSAASNAPRAEVRTYPIGHFDIYVGEPFEQAVADQTDFLVRHVLS
jgi:dienelactone hydrolase